MVESIKVHNHVRKIFRKCGVIVCVIWNAYAIDLDMSGNWGGKSQAGYFFTHSNVPSVIKGRPVFVVDCSYSLEFGKLSEEVDRVVEEIVDFLLDIPKRLQQALEGPHTHSLELPRAVT